MRNCRKTGTAIAFPTMLPMAFSEIIDVSSLPGQPPPAPQAGPAPRTSSPTSSSGRPSGRSWRSRWRPGRPKIVAGSSRQRTGRGRNPMRFTWPSSPPRPRRVHLPCPRPCRCAASKGAARPARPMRSFLQTKRCRRRPGRLGAHGASDWCRTCSSLGARSLAPAASPAERSRHARRANAVFLAGDAPTGVAEIYFSRRSLLVASAGFECGRSRGSHRTGNPPLLWAITRKKNGGPFIPIRPDPKHSSSLVFRSCTYPVA